MIGKQPYSCPHLLLKSVGPFIVYSTVFSVIHQMSGSLDYDPDNRSTPNKNGKHI